MSLSNTTADNPPSGIDSVNTTAPMAVSKLYASLFCCPLETHVASAFLSCAPVVTLFVEEQLESYFSAFPVLLSAKEFERRKKREK